MSYPLLTQGAALQQVKAFFDRLKNGEEMEDPQGPAMAATATV